jgi:ribosome assembly protein RRB1
VQVWYGTAASLKPGEELTWNPEAYNMLHRFALPWPCLSFDIFPDALGSGRSRYPHTAYIVAGSSVSGGEKNALYFAKLSDMFRTQRDNDSDDEAIASDSDPDDDAVMGLQSFNHPGCVNRVRIMPQVPNVVATWSETGSVYLWDARFKLAALDAMAEDEGALGKTQTAALRRRGTTPSGPVFEFAGHTTEGYAMDWSPTHAGRLATGDCSGAGVVWDPVAAGPAVRLGPKSTALGTVEGVTWLQRNQGLTGHTSSIEDLQWSPTEVDVLASCSSDRTVCIWDTRDPRKPAFRIKASASADINVISWNRKVPYMLLSGADDGEFCIWDLREVIAGGPKAEEPLARSTWHRSPITSIEWSPHDENCLAVCSEDDTVTIWDMSLEPEVDAEAEAAAQQGEPEYPAQLLFMHQGQSHIKEVHFHEKIPGCLITTAETGFNVFKPDVKLA